MRILQVCPRIPYPLHDGGAIGVFNITKHLALRGHHIHMVTFGPSDAGSLEELRRYCELSLVRRRARSRCVGALATLLSRCPYTVSRYHSDSMFRRLRDLMGQIAVDVVHVDHLHMAAYGLFLKEHYGLPAVLREHNVESTVMERFAHNQKNPFLRWYAGFQCRKLWQYESDVCSRFDRCVMITRQDEERILAVSDRVRTTVIPAGVDIPAPEAPPAEESGNVLFLAAMHWPPNVEGLLWFCGEVLPRVLAEEPQAVLTVVGKVPPTPLRLPASPGIRFIGFVESVVPWIEAAQVCIVPLLTGGGMRVKILQMFARRKCVVSTSVGCEGLAVQDGRELLIADDAEGFARAVVSALRNPARRAMLGENARQLAENKYDWRQIGAAFEATYGQVLAEGVGHG